MTLAGGRQGSPRTLSKGSGSELMIPCASRFNPQGETSYWLKGCSNRSNWLVTGAPCSLHAGLGSPNSWKRLIRCYREQKEVQTLLKR